MALRCVLRKMPALGLRSPPMGPLMGSVRRALSPATSSRLISSQGAPGARTVQSEGALAEQIESLKLRQAELYRKSAEQERRAAEEFERSMEQHRQDMASGEALLRRTSEEFERSLEKHEVLVKTCKVLDVAFPAAAVLLTIHLSM